MPWLVGAGIAAVMFPRVCGGDSCWRDDFGVGILRAERTDTTLSFCVEVRPVFAGDGELPVADVRSSCECLEVSGRLQDSQISGKQAVLVLYGLLHLSGIPQDVVPGVYVTHAGKAAHFVSLEKLLVRTVR